MPSHLNAFPINADSRIFVVIGSNIMGNKANDNIQLYALKHDRRNNKNAKAAIFPDGR